MANADERMTNVEQEDSDSEKQEDGSNNESRRPPPTAFSVAQALSMVRQKREEQERARQEEAKLLDEQKRERAKEKRQRRRKNQKEKKAKLKEASAASATMQTETTPPTSDVMPPDKQDCSMNEDSDRTVGLKRPHDHETHGDDRPNEQKTDDEIDLKRLPVKKRLRIKSAEVAPGDASKPIDDSSVSKESATPARRVTTLLPRALLLKSVKR